MKTGVLVHGCHLGAFDWRGIAWGHKDKQMLGRIPKGVLVAHEYDADVVIFGTGASKKTVIENEGTDRQVSVEKVEGQYTLDYMLRHFEDLHDFRQFKGLDLGHLKRRMTEISIADVESTNTVTELRNAAIEFGKRDIQRFMLVSSPTHISRCIKHACSVLMTDDLRHFHDRLLATPSDTCYMGHRPEDVVIFEPPHRKDKHSQPLHLNMSRVLRIPEKDLERFLTRIDAILQEEFGV